MGRSGGHPYRPHPLAPRRRGPAQARARPFTVLPGNSAPLACAADFAYLCRRLRKLTQVTFCDFSGINAIVLLHKYTRAAGGELVLLRPPPPVAALLTRTGIAGHLRIADALGDAPEPGPAAPEPT